MKLLQYLTHCVMHSRPRLGSGSTGASGSAMNGLGGFEEQGYVGGVLDGYDDDDEEDDEEEEEEEEERGFVQVGAVPSLSVGGDELVRSSNKTDSALLDSGLREEAAFVHISRYYPATSTEAAASNGGDNSGSGSVKSNAAAAPLL